MKVKLLFSTLATTVASFMLSTQSLALSLKDGAAQRGAEAARGVGVPETIFGEAGTITNFVNILLFIVGGLTVLMIIVGGLRYVVSGGDAKKVEGAKNTIALLSYAIVNFVLGGLIGSGGSAGTDL